VEGAGFEDFEITWRGDVFSGAPQHSSAAEFGTQGITFRAVKPEREAREQGLRGDHLFHRIPQM